MKKRGVIIIFLIFILLFSTLVSAYSFVGRAIDDIEISLSSGDKKAERAMDARENEIDDAINNIKEGNTEEAIKNLERAKEKLEIVQEQASPEIAEEIKTNSEEITKKILENKDINPDFSVYFEQHISEEKKTQLSADLSEKLFSYCEELAKQDYELMLKDEKCNPDNAPVWLNDKVDENVGELQKEAAEKMLEIFTACINNPKECDCSEIPIDSEKSKCEKGKALSIRCEFQSDESACRELDEMEIEMPSNLPKFLQPLFKKKITDAINNKEEEMFDQFAPKECADAGAKTREGCESIMMEKYAPRECIEAGATTKEECDKIMTGIHGAPPTECMEKGEFIGSEACEQKMVKSGMIPQECIENGKPLPPEDCNQIMQEKGMMGQTGIPQECIKDGQPIPEEECIQIMQEKGISMGPPPECEGLSKEECDKIMQEKGPMTGNEMMSGECKELGITDFYECQKIVNLPRPCKDAGMYSMEECEGTLMQQSMPKECVDAGALTPRTCKQIMLPSECKEIGALNWEDCETSRIINQMPVECQEKGAVSPDECAKLMAKNIIVGSPGSETEFLNKRGIEFDDIPNVCKTGSNFVRSMECDEALAEMGITLPSPSDTSQIPSECMENGVPVSPQECETVLQGKLVTENIPGPCREAGITNPEDCGRFIEKQRGEQGLGMNIPQECLGLSPEDCKRIMEEKGIEVKQIVKDQMGVTNECMEVGVDDESSCEIIMSKINGERIKNGEKMIIDEKGNQDYITPGEITQIAEEAEIRAEKKEIDLGTAEEYKQEVEYYEKQIERVEQTSMTEQANIINQQEFSGGGEEAGGGESSAGGEEGGGESSGGGESPITTGETVREIKGRGLLSEFFDRTFNR